MAPLQLQQASRKEFLAHSKQCQDSLLSNSTRQGLDFSRNEFEVDVWLNKGNKPAWVASQLATTGAWLNTNVETRFAPLQACATTLGHFKFRMCMKLCEDGLVYEAVDALDLLVQRGCHVPGDLFYRVIKRCIEQKDLALGRRIHALTVKSGYEGDAFLATHLIGLYASHGRLGEAMGVFTKVSAPDTYNWATIISAYARHGKVADAGEAIRLYRQMCQSTTIKPDDRLYSAVLKACASARNLVAGKEVHAHILASPEEPGRFVQAGLVNMYAKCGNLQDARELFDKLSDRDVVLWTSMIAGYAQQGMGHEAISLYRSMQLEGLTNPNAVTYVCMLQACASIGVGAFEEGKQLHAEIVKKGVQDDVVVGGSLVNMYAKCGSLEHARKLFDSLAEKNVVAWNAMVAGYAQQGMGQQALDLYTSMQKAGLCANSVTYVSLLQACACVGEGAFAKGKELHAQIQERGLERDVVVGGSLVNMYAKCGRLKEARIEFDKLQNKDVVTWTAIIAGYAEQGMGEEALGLHRSMQQEGLYPNSVTYVCLLQACATIGLPALVQGKELHASIKARGLQEDVCLGGSLVNMYAKCGSLEDAQRMFSELSERSVVAWNAMIGAYAQRGMGQKSLSLYRSMQLESLTPPNCITYICLLQACASLGVSALDEGKQLHAEIKQQGLQEDPVVGGSLVNMYAKCGSLHDAHRLFDTLSEKTVVAWNAMIAGYAQQGLSEEAFSLHRCMQQDGLTSPNSVTYVCLLQACASVGVDALDEGKQLHAHITQRGLQDDGSLLVSLVNMYAKCCSLEDARSLFDKLPDKNVVAWNAMIAGYSQQGMGQEALRLYSSMRLEGFTPDCFTYVSLLQACASVGIGALSEGKQFHVQIKELGLEEDVVLGSSLVNMHARCGNLEDARSVFEKLPERSTAAWNTIISGYAHQGMGEDALNLYRCMQEKGSTPDSVTFVSLLLACASIGSEALEEGKQLHAQIEKLGPQEELALGVSLVNMYGKCGSTEEARKVFDKLAERNLVTWNAMIAGYAQQGMCEDALSLYTQMQQEGITPDSVTYVCLLQACAAVAAFSLGKQLHVEIDERGEQVDGIVGASLVNMYAKCGSMYDSQRVFESLSEKSNEVYSALIGGYARQGDSQAVFDLLDRMKLDHIFPDEITFLSVLTVCSHVGLVDEGRKYFEAMTTDYGLSATMEHYICMVDLLGRAGHLDEALQIVKTMPYSPNNVLWLTLLSASRKWNNVEIAQQAFEGVLRVGSRDNTSM